MISKFNGTSTPKGSNGDVVSKLFVVSNVQLVNQYYASISEAACIGQPDRLDDCRHIEETLQIYKVNAKLPVMTV